MPFLRMRADNANSVDEGVPIAAINQQHDRNGSRNAGDHLSEMRRPAQSQQKDHDGRGAEVRDKREL